MIYLYCLTDAHPKDLEFISPESASLLPFDQYTVVFCNKDRSRLYSDRDVMMHYDVSALIMRQCITVLPFAYGTFLPAGEAIAFLEKKKKAIEVAMATFRDKEEMGMKVLVPAGDSGAELQKRLGESPGHRYLSGRMSNHGPALSGLETLSPFRREVEQRFAPICTRIKFKAHCVPKSILANVSFLIERQNIDTFSNALRNLKHAFPCYKFLISGPWPAYNFIDLPDDVGM